MDMFSAGSAVLLSVPLTAGRSVDIRITVPASAVDGGAPLVTDADAETAGTAGA